MVGNSLRVYWRSAGSSHSYITELSSSSNNYTCSASPGENRCDVASVQCGDVYNVTVAPLTPEGTKVPFCPQRLYSGMTDRFQWLTLYLAVIPDNIFKVVSLVERFHISLCIVIQLMTCHNLIYCMQLENNKQKCIPDVTLQIWKSTFWLNLLLFCSCSLSHMLGE